MNALSRRTLLRGAGTALALPWLQAMVPVRRTSPAPPRRLVYVYTPNGVRIDRWTPEAEGGDYALSSTLSPLAPFRERLSVLSGLTHDKGRANGDGPGDHARAASTWLTGVQPLKDKGAVRLGVSADQVAAAAIGDATRFRSLQLGCEAGRASGQCDSGYACHYSNHISWKDATTPTGKEVLPQRVFDRLFRGGDADASSAAAGARRARRRSVLDFVREDVSSLRARLGHEDRRTLADFMSGVRELERRLDFADALRVEVPDDARPPGVPRSYREHVRRQMDLIALALQTDVVRVVTFMVANEGSNRAYREQDVAEGHHTLSHHGRDPEKLAKIERIDRFHVEQLAYLLGRLAELPEGEGDLLDAVLLLHGSGLADGNAHDHGNLPLVLCGHGGGSLRPGRHVRYPRETPAMDLHLALLERVGAPRAALGDSRGVLEGI